MPIAESLEAGTLRALRALLDALPLHAEEGGIREALPESDLVAQVKTTRSASAGADVVVAMVRRLFDALGLLEPSELSSGRWAFVSFPASLLARSVLETLATDGHGFFEPGYWIQGSHRLPELVEEQRALLRHLEGHRIHAHPTQSANPIRTVHVAWGVIRLGNDFLLRVREDRRRPEVRGFVFPGGRLDLTDLPRTARSSHSLRDLLQTQSKLAADALPTTLARELREELGLLPSEYDAAFLRTIGPFKMLEGTRNNHVYTIYNIALSAVRLSRAGELRVLDRVAMEPRWWAWFTAGELAAGQRSDGSSAFVDALATELGDKTEEFLRIEVPESSGTPPVYRLENDSIELPARPSEPLLKGMAGRERAFAFAPSAFQWELLMLLARHTRGLQVQLRGEPIALLGGRWIKLQDGSVLEAALELVRQLGALGFPFVEVDALGHCRLSVDADEVFFHPACFEYSWQLEGAKKKSISLTLKAIETQWGQLPEHSIDIPLAPQFARDLATVERGGSPIGDFEREGRRLFEPARRIGLRKFIEVLKGAPEIVVPGRS